MLGVDARRVVATVTNEHPLWDRATCLCVRESMREDCSAADPNLAVAPLVREAVSGPQPASGVGFRLNAIPESVHVRDITVMVIA